MATEIKVELPAEIPKTAVKFLQQLFGSVTEASEYFADKIRYARWKAAVRRVEDAAKFAKEHGLSCNEVPIKFLVPFLEKASLEDESSELSRLWSKLLANASNKFEWKLALLPEILSQIGAAEALLLGQLVNSTLEWSSQEGREEFVMDISGQERKVQLILTELMGGFCGNSSAYDGRLTLEQVLASAKLSAPVENCGLLKLAVIIEKDDRIEERNFYADRHDELLDSVWVLERQGLTARRSKIETRARTAVSLEWVEATRLGFELISVCDHVPAVPVSVKKILSGGSLKFSAIRDFFGEPAKS